MSAIPKLKNILSVLFLSFISVGHSWAQNCNINQEFVKELIFENQSIINKKEFDPNYNYKILYEHIDQVWENNFATNSKYLGLKKLELKKSFKSTLIGMQSTFHLLPYLILGNECKIKIHKLNGKGKVSVEICTMDEKGEVYNHEALKFNDTRAKRNDSSEFVEIELTQMKGKILAIFMQSKSVSKNFEYEITLTD